MTRVVLLGPDDDARRELHLVLARAGREVAAVAEVEAASRYLADRTAAAVFVLGEALDAARVLPAATPVIAVQPARDDAAAIALLDAGVADVIVAPVDEPAVALALRRLANKVAMPPASTPRPRTLLGDSEPMERVRALVGQVARAKSTVLVTGESGTGKELVARALHDASPRAHRRFIAVNCAAIPGPLLESELFGHVRGAFTDAVRDKTGMFEEADGGTLFLDEIGELPLALQSKLLRAIAEGAINRVGESTPIAIDVRLVAATLRDLTADVAAGRFREDLYYRLAVVPIQLPPLRDRPGDIAALAQAFAARRAATLTTEQLASLTARPWPGNVRELENAVERLVVLGDLDQLPQARPIAVDPAALSIKKATRDLEQDLIRKALDATNGNRTNAAKLLELSHRALLYKMKEYGIS